MNRELYPPLASIKKAAALTPSNARVWGRLGTALTRERPEEGVSKRARQTAVQQAWERAVSLNPVSGRLWYGLSLSYASPSTRTWTSRERRTRRDTATLTAALLRPQDAELLARAGRYFAWRSTTLPDRSAPELAQPSGRDFTWWRQWHETGTLPLPATRLQALAAAAHLMRTATSLNRGMWKQCAEDMWKYGRDREMVLEVVPEGNGWVQKRVEKWLQEKA